MSLFYRFNIALLLGGALAGSAYSEALPPDHAERMTRGLALFQQDVAVILKEQCVKCHGGEKTKGDFDLSTREALLRGGSDGPAIQPFASETSSLVKMIRHEVKPSMPEKAPKLSEATIAKIAEWIELGAPYDAPLIAGKATARDKSVVTDADRQWWSFQPLAKISPQIHAHPVDALLLAKAASSELKLAPQADKRILIRRATLDLLGLPPTPEEVAAYLADPSPNAWEKVIDRLLASPHYGERWARHWLDVARFAESSGFEHDYDRPYAYYYRDFIIKALNNDMPFDQFARWQIAGDEFEPQNPLAMMAPQAFWARGCSPRRSRRMKWSARATMRWTICWLQPRARFSA